MHSFCFFSIKKDKSLLDSRRGFFHSISRYAINLYLWSKVDIMEITEVKISLLKAADYNPRKISENQIEQLKTSLLEFGFVDPVIVNSRKGRKNIIIGGHQRVKAWEALGNKTAPVHYIDLSEEKEKELNIRLNQNGGEFDLSLLEQHFDPEDLIEFGFKPEDLEFEEDDEIDYSILNDDDEIDDQADKMAEGVRKGILIDFAPDKYEEAFALIKFFRERDADVGEMVREFLKEEKLKVDESN